MLRPCSLHTMSRILRRRWDIVGSSSVKGGLRTMTTKTEDEMNKKGPAAGERLMSDFWAVYGWQGAAVLVSGVSLAVWLGIYSVNHRIDALGNRIDALGNRIDAKFDALGNRIDAKMAENQNELKGILLDHQKWTADQVWKQDEEIKKQAEILNQYVFQDDE